MQIYWYYPLFPLLVFAHFVFNAVSIWLFGHILIVQYLFSMATQQYLHHLHDDMLRSVWTMRRLSMCSVVCSSATLSLLTATYNIDTALCVPMLWTVSALCLTMNFVRNRMHCLSATAPLRVCCRCPRRKRPHQIHSEPLTPPHAHYDDHARFQLQVHQSVALDLDAATTSTQSVDPLPNTVPALLTIDSGKEMDSVPRHGAFSPVQGVNAMEPIQEHETLDAVDSEERSRDRDRSASPYSSHRGVHSPKTPGHPPSIVLSPTPEHDAPAHCAEHEHVGHRHFVHPSPSRSGSQTASRWYQQIRNRISTPLPLTLQQKQSPSAQDQSVRGGSDLTLSPIAVETPAHSKALQLLGVDHGATPRHRSHGGAHGGAHGGGLSAKRPSRSTMGRLSRSYAPPTTPMPSLFNHLYSNRLLFPSGPRPSTSTMTPKHAESARADHQRPDYGKEEAADSDELTLAALSKSDPIKPAQRRQSSKTPKSQFSRKKKENELSLLDVDGSPFPFQEIDSAKSDGDAVSEPVGCEPHLERSKSSGHLRTIKIEDGDGEVIQIGIGSRSLSERSTRGYHDGTGRVEQPRTSSLHQSHGNALTTPDVVHLFKVLSYHGLFPKKQVNDAQQLRDYHLNL